MSDHHITAKELAASISGMADHSAPFQSVHLELGLAHLEQLAMRAQKGTRAITAFYVGKGSFHDLGDAAVLIHATAFEPVVARCAQGTARNLQEIADLEARGACAMDEPLLDALAEFSGQARAVLVALRIALQAHAALDSCLLHLGGQMTPADALSRRLVADNLAEALTALGVEL